ncbi:hypothetical protein WA1_02335 [Scytonema hofmannii PCC 7110]|uniref:Uncharacterized protein n=1 Tax=Scytonema hofmannii PCC 7110 TaxID=128403 RepID=A0A139XH63_9CYAN|nr:hypothetical protein [Scytonema hofmannii]KYC44003.1 hypothetical protein WA1_02335 [Scytonema hofmannii PCC 7110]
MVRKQSLPYRCDARTAFTKIYDKVELIFGCSSKALTAIAFNKNAQISNFYLRIDVIKNI